ncbi:serine protease [Gigaspora margarita]|uniref:Serine protease n=1 Tax=Gigaspora margarita TaxID=4874 RepID=A0A8H4ET38_GIGMA|nr:serine protease [Gigaspora margarita]
MVITSHSSVTSVIFRRKNIDNTLVFLTSERIEETLRFKNKHKGNNENEKRNVNSRSIVVPPVFSQVSPEYNYPIGRFSIRLPDGDDRICTASIINTANGNIGITAAHCLIDDNGEILDTNSMWFSPGYDNGTDGPLELIEVEDVAVPLTFLVTDAWNDYALVKFAFNDPAEENETLQHYTGGLGWRFDIGNNTLTNIFCYPLTGNLENCTKDGEHLCKWQGYTQLEQGNHSFNYIISDIRLGVGASGGPLIFQYDRSINLGYVYSVHRAWRNDTNESIASIFDQLVFNGLLLQLS